MAIIETRLRRLETLAARLRSGKAQAEADAESERYFASLSSDDISFVYQCTMHKSWDQLTSAEQARLETLMAPIDPTGSGLRLLQNPPASPISPDMPLAEAAAIYRRMLSQGRPLAAR